jgi:hypothetical protein
VLGARQLVDDHFAAYEDELLEDYEEIAAILDEVYRDYDDALSPDAAE